MASAQHMRVGACLLAFERTLCCYLEYYMVEFKKVLLEKMHFIERYVVI